MSMTQQSSRYRIGQCECGAIVLFGMCGGFGAIVSSEPIPWDAWTPIAETGRWVFTLKHGYLVRANQSWTPRDAELHAEHKCGSRRMPIPFAKQKKKGAYAGSALNASRTSRRSDSLAAAWPPLRNCAICNKKLK